MYNTKYEIYTRRSEQITGDYASGTTHFSPLPTFNRPTPQYSQHASNVHNIVKDVWLSIQAAQWQEAYTLMFQEGLLDDLIHKGSYASILEICQAFLVQQAWPLAPEQRALISLSAGQSYSWLGNREQALNLYGQALACYREVGDRSGQATTLNNLGLILYASGNLPEALGYFEHSLTL